MVPGDVCLVSLMAGTASLFIKRSLTGECAGREGWTGPSVPDLVTDSAEPLVTAAPPCGEGRLALSSHHT